MGKKEKLKELKTKNEEMDKTISEIEKIKKDNDTEKLKKINHDMGIIISTHIAKIEEAAIKGTIDKIQEHQKKEDEL